MIFVIFLHGHDFLAEFVSTQKTQLVLQQNKSSFVHAVCYNNHIIGYMKDSKLKTAQTSNWILRLFRDWFSGLSVTSQSTWMIFIWVTSSNVYFSALIVWSEDKFIQNSNIWIIQIFQISALCPNPFWLLLSDKISMRLQQKNSPRSQNRCQIS